MHGATIFTPWIKVVGRLVIQLSSSQRVREIYDGGAVHVSSNGALNSVGIIVRINQQRFTEERLFSGVNEDKQRCFS